MKQTSIAVVGNEADSAEELAAAIRRFGHAVSAVFPSGQAAITKCKALRPDLVLMNLGSDAATETLEAARQIRLRYRIPVIYLTACSDANILSMARATGPHALLTHPVHEGDLQAAVAGALHHRQTERKLQRARQRAADRRLIISREMEAVSKFAAAITHDLDNMLNAIEGHATSVMENVLAGTAAHEESAGLIEAVRRGRELSHRIRTAAMLNQPPADSVVLPVSLGETVRRAIERLTAETPKVGVATSPRRLDRMPWVLADKTLITDAVADVLLNAAASMPAGGTIRVSAARRIAVPPSVSPGRRHRRCYVVLTVRYTGTGMRTESVAAGLKPALSPQGLGGRSGLGLLATPRAVQRCQGWVEIAGDARRGTTVRLFLPHAHAPRRKQSPSLDALEGASVLLADDDEDLLRVSGTMLRKSGLHVYAAHGGRAAINVYRRHGPKVDVSIVDAIMPGPSGSEVITAIARMNPEARIVVTSGFAREYARTLVPPGAWTFLQKPFDHEQLLATLRRTLSQPLAPR